MMNVRRVIRECRKRRGLHVNKYVMDGMTIKIKRWRLKIKENDIDNTTPPPPPPNNGGGGGKKKKKKTKKTPPPPPPPKTGEVR